MNRVLPSRPDRVGAGCHLSFLSGLHGRFTW